MKTMNYRILQPIIGRLLHGPSLDEYTLDEKSFQLLLEIQKELSVFEPIEDDEARKIPWGKRKGQEMSIKDELKRMQNVLLKLQVWH